MSHPQYDLDHVNSVFQENYRDAYLDYMLRPTRKGLPGRVAEMMNSVRAGAGTMLIAAGEGLRPHAVTGPEDVTRGAADAVAPFAIEHGSS